MSICKAVQPAVLHPAYKTDSLPDCWPSNDLESASCTVRLANKQIDLQASPIQGNPHLQRVSHLQVYEMVLHTALTEQRCGPRNLPLTGSWRWLLREVRGLPRNCRFGRRLRPRLNACACKHEP